MKKATKAKICEAIETIGNQPITYVYKYLALRAILRAICEYKNENTILERCDWEIKMSKDHYQEIMEVSNAANSSSQKEMV